jgi:ribosomal protein S18 acetylase RimI-like enzyme
MSCSASKTQNMNNTAETKNMHSFWQTKPVLKKGDFVYKSTEIDNLNNRSIYNSSVPSKLPDIMEWKLIDRANNSEMNNACEFLTRYYTLKNPKIHFSLDLLDWCLGADGVVLTIINKKTKAIAGIICCEIQNTVVYERIEKFAHTQFLCTHPVYRGKNMAKLLINELSRHLFMKCGISQGIFESEEKLMQPTSTIRIYARPLNYNKLHRTEFIMTEEKNIDTLHKNFLITDGLDSNYLIMQESHMEEVYKLYNLYISKFNMSRKYTKKELTATLLNNKIVKSYVVMSDDKIVDFVSYCNIQYDTETDPVNAAYLFLYTLNTEYGESMVDHVLRIMAAKDVDIMITNDSMVMNDIILTAKYDVDEYDSDSESYSKVFEHKLLKQEKKYVNLFNWKCPYIPADRLSFFCL